MNNTIEYPVRSDRMVVVRPIDLSHVSDVFSVTIFPFPNPVYRQICLFLPVIVLYYLLIVSSPSKRRRTSSHPGLLPPMVSYRIPFVGHALGFHFNRRKFAAKIKEIGRNGIPLRIKLLGHNVTVVADRKHIQEVFRSKLLDNRPAFELALKLFFDLPTAAHTLWLQDDSGEAPRPRPHSSIPDTDRVYHLTHNITQTSLTGSNLKGLALHFQDNYNQILMRTPTSHEWTHMDDLHAFVQTTMSTAAIQALCGPAFLKMNPTLIQDLWTYDGGLPHFFGGIPKFSNPTAYHARARILKGIEKWHIWARASFEEGSIAADGHDPYWGAKFMRRRQAMWDRIETMDAAGRASEDLAIIWGQNSNSVAGAFWCLVNILKDRVLVERVRIEVNKCVVTSPSESSTEQAPYFDGEKLCKNPLLQSVWSEAMRMYAAMFLVRRSDYADFEFGGQYTLPQRELIAVDAWACHHDPENWNEGTSDNPHPVDTFWADRFLVYPEDPTSGPAKPGVDAQPVHNTQNGPHYSTAGLAGAFYPFGGGRHSCPGMHFAKQEMMLCMATMVTLFDVEFDPDLKLEPDMDFFGLGVLPLKGTAPCRIRWRQQCQV